MKKRAMRRFCVRRLYFCMVARAAVPTSAVGRYSSSCRRATAFGGRGSFRFLTRATIGAAFIGQTIYGLHKLPIGLHELPASPVVQL